MPSGVRLVGSAQLRKAVQVIEPTLTREFTKAHRVVGVRLTSISRDAASGGTRQQQAAAPAIKALATFRSAGIAFTPTSDIPFVKGAFYGSLKWPQFWGGGGPNWVGNSWGVGVPGQGPYRINDAIAEHNGEVIGLYVAVLNAVLAQVAAAAAI